MIVSRRFAEEPTIAFRDQPTTVGHRPSTELRRQAMPTNVGVRVYYMPPPSVARPPAPPPAPSTTDTTLPSKRRAAAANNAPTVARPVQRAPSRARRFLSLVAVCFVAMMFGVGLGFMVREGQARASYSSSSSASSNHHSRTAHCEAAHGLVSLGPEVKAPSPVVRRVRASTKPPTSALATAASTTTSPAPTPAQASFDDFEPSFRVSP